MSTLAVISNVLNVNYTEHLLPFTEAYGTREIFCCADRRLVDWADRWMLVPVSNITSEKAIGACDAIVVFELELDGMPYVINRTVASGKPYVVFECDDHGNVLYVK